MEQEEPKENAPETPEDDSEEEVPVGNKTVEEILAETGLLEEPTEDDGTDEVMQDQDQGQGQQQQQGQGGGQTGYTDETVKAIPDALAAAGFGAEKPPVAGEANPNGGGTINWG